MDEKLDNCHSEDDTDCLKENDHENIREKTNKNDGYEATLIDDLLRAIGLGHLLSKRKSKVKKEEKLVQSNNSPQTCYSEEHSTFTQNPQSILEEEDADLQSEVSGGDIVEKKFRPKRIFFLVLLIALAFVSYQIISVLLEPSPPSKDVVATYNGKSITVNQLMEYIKVEGVRDNEHGICEKHGFDHSQCDEFEECETHPVHSLESYQQIVKMIAVEKIIEDWANENGITQRDDVEHGLKDLIKDINLESLMGKIHEKELSPDSIPKWKVQQYFDENKDQYYGKVFNDVEAEIREILAVQKDESYFPEYVEKLKQSAGLEVNFELLKVDDPTEEDMNLYYEKNADNFIAKAKADIVELEIDVSKKSGDAITLANEALSKLRAGESFETIVEKYGVDKKVSTISVTQGERTEGFDQEVFRLEENEVSAPLEYGGNIYLIKMLNKEKQKQKSFTEVKDQVKEILIEEKTKAQYELKKDEALFTVHSKRYTLGEFIVEFEELPLEYQTAFAGYEGKKSLVEQMITKELLLEEYGDEAKSDDSKHKIDDMKKQYLAQILHEEEIDNKIGDITDAEAMEFYEENKKNLIEPAKVKLSFIWVDEGVDGEFTEQANTRANEALVEIESGKDFSEVVKQYSDDATAATGGVIDEWLIEEHLSPEFAKAIFSLNVNEVSPMIKSQGGLYIFKVREKEEAKELSFDEVKEDIKNHLLDEKHLEMEGNLENELLEKSKLIIYDKTLRVLLETNLKK
ncbi:MAG: hypothetical protein CVV00_01645 [Firmicutes bacterium HGW-Firmicutes-5]|nr:MAG: hypothetical protein CVV00_01645 [Firmicutes bacterium HGW-Firmicutes-5]